MAAPPPYAMQQTGYAQPVQTAQYAQPQPGVQYAQPVQYAPAPQPGAQYAQPVQYAQQPGAQYAQQPQSQVMQDELSGILGPQSGIIVRQKLDVQEIFCPALQKQNKYKVGVRPHGISEDAANWEDKTFKKSLKRQPLFTLKEKSEFCDRLCCGRWRNFTMDVTASKKAGGSKQKIAEFQRPFKCSIYCFCCLLNPQEISSVDTRSGKPLGRTVEDFRCCDHMCLKRHWRVLDAGGDTKYVIRDDICCNANCCAPTCCCPVRKLDILDSSEQNVVGSITDFWPGCTTRGCLGTADNFKLEFPPDANPAVKTQLMASLILIDFLLFEKTENNNNNGLAAQMM